MGAQPAIKGTGGALASKQRSLSLATAPDHLAEPLSQPRFIRRLSRQEVVDLHAAPARLLDRQDVGEKARPVAVVVAIGKSALIAVDPLAILKIIEIAQHLAAGRQF